MKKAIKILFSPLVIAMILVALIMAGLVTVGVFGTGILLMLMFKSRRETRFGAWVWRRLEGIGWTWTSFMWGASLFPFMWIWRKITGSFPPLPPGTQRMNVGIHPSYLASLGSAHATTVMDRTPMKILGKVENRTHWFNGFLIRTAELLGWVILLDRKTPGRALQQIAEGIANITKSVAYLLYLDQHRFSSKWRARDIEKHGGKIPRIQDFDQTLVPSTPGMWEILSTLRAKGIPVQVIDTNVFFDCQDLGFWSLFQIFGSVLHIEIEDITAEIATIETEEQLRAYMNERYRDKNRHMREVRRLPHPQ